METIIRDYFKRLEDQVIFINNLETYTERLLEFKLLELSSKEYREILGDKKGFGNRRTKRKANRIKNRVIKV